MTQETTAPQSNKKGFTAKGGFFLGIGTSVIIAALAVIAFRYDGNAQPLVNSPNAQVVALAAATETIPVAEHVAAMTEPPAQATTAATAVSQPHASASAHTALLSGSIELDQSIASSVSGAVTVFVIARDGNGKGHPIFAKRLEVASFPTKFSLGPEDSMMGQAPPDHVSLEARIDLDRDAMTREAGVPAAKIESVAIASRDVTLTLKR